MENQTGLKEILVRRIHPDTQIEVHNLNLSIEAVKEWLREKRKEAIKTGCTYNAELTITALIGELEKIPQ